MHDIQTIAFSMGSKKNVARNVCVGFIARQKPPHATNCSYNTPNKTDFIRTKMFPHFGNLVSIRRLNAMNPQEFDLKISGLKFIQGSRSICVSVCVSMCVCPHVWNLDWSF